MAVKQYTELEKLSIEVNVMLDFLHDKRDWVSLNTIRYKFPVASRKQEVFIANGISKKLIGKNTYHCYNKHVKWWRPLHDCIAFNKCNATFCLLDLDKSKRTILASDNKCILTNNKPEGDVKMEFYDPEDNNETFEEQVPDEFFEDDEPVLNEDDDFEDEDDLFGDRDVDED